uniref:TRAF-type domain-containing protein n=1 Tax=Macrostomum lignano TaxID=282301 RepID=A0A1I8FTD1_9PLAT
SRLGRDNHIVFAVHVVVNDITLTLDVCAVTHVETATVKRLRRVPTQVKNLPKRDDNHNWDFTTSAGINVAGQCQQGSDFSGWPGANIPAGIHAAGSRRKRQVRACPPPVGLLQSEQKHFLHRLWAVRLVSDDMALPAGVAGAHFAGTGQAGVTSSNNTLTAPSHAGQIDNDEFPRSSAVNIKVEEHHLLAICEGCDISIIPGLQLRSTKPIRSLWITWSPAVEFLIGWPIPNHLMCSGCSELLINSYQTPHGCRLCQRCFSTELLQSSDRVCPCIHSLDSCRDRARLVEHFVSQAVCFPDTATRKDVLELEVRCRTKSPALDSHLTNECQFEIVTCDRCSERVRQFELNGCHTDLRSPHCCSEFRAPCPHCSDSSSRLYRSEFQEHLMTCPERPSDCKYRQSIGCQTNVAMSQLDEHYCSGTDGHLELTVQRFQQELQRKDSELKEINNLLMKLKTRDKQRAIEVGQLKEKVLKLTERLSTFEKSPLLKTLLNQGRRLSNGDLTEQPVEEDNQSQQDAAVKELNRMGRRRSLNSSITNDKHTSFKRRDALAQGIRWERQRFWCVYQASCARVVENVLLGISTVIWFSCSPQAGIELQTTVQPPPPSAWLGTSLFLVATEPDVQAAELGVDEAQLLSVQHVGHDDEVGLVGADLPAPLPAGRAVHQPVANRESNRWESNSGGQSFPGGRPGRCFTKTRPKAEQLALQSRTPLLHLSNTNSWQGPRAKLKAWQRGLLAQSSEHRTSDAAALLPRGVSVNSLPMHRLAFTAVNACCDEHRLLPAVTEISRHCSSSRIAGNLLRIFISRL